MDDWQEQTLPVKGTVFLLMFDGHVCGAYDTYEAANHAMTRTMGTGAAQLYEIHDLDVQTLPDDHEDAHREELERRSGVRESERASMCELVTRLCDECDDIPFPRRSEPVGTYMDGRDEVVEGTRRYMNDLTQWKALVRERVASDSDLRSDSPPVADRVIESLLATKVTGAPAAGRRSTSATHHS